MASRHCPQRYWENRQDECPGLLTADTPSRLGPLATGSLMQLLRWRAQLGGQEVGLTRCPGDTRD